MNSWILTSLTAFFKAFWGIFQKSGLFSIITGIYNACSRSWENSVIMTALRRDCRDGMAAKSICGRFLRLPFAVMEKLRNSLGGFLKEKAEKSFICNLANIYVQNFMAVNIRFFGMMLLSMSLAYTFIKFAMNGSLSRISLITAVIGAVVSLVNFNLMGFLNPSKVVTFVKNAAGFRGLNFEFYDEKKTKGALRIALSVITGFVSGAVMCFAPLYGAAVPFLIFGGLLVLIYPVTGVFAAVFIAPIVPTLLLAAVCIWTGLSLILHSLVDENFKWRFEGIGVSILIFLAVLFISSLASFAPMGSLKVWAMYFVFTLFYFVIINTIKTKNQLYSLLKIFVISGAVVALYGVLQYVFGWTTANAWIDETMFENDTMRVYSTLANPNVLGEFLLLVLPVTAVFVLKEKCRYLSKWAYMAMFAVLGLCLVLTQSRGCWIGFMISIVVFVTFYEGRWWACIPVVLLLLPMIVPDTVVDRIASVGNMEDSSTSYRVYIWMGTLGMMKHYWLGGIGMGEAAFSQVYPLFMYNAIIAPHSHNTFLQLLVEAGIGGLAVFLVMQGVFMVKMHTLYQMDYKKNRDSAMALAIASGVIAFLVQSLFDYTFYNYRVMAIFFMVMAFGTALKYIKSGEEELA